MGVVGQVGNITFGYADVDDAFPAVDCGHTPMGRFVIVQIRSPKSRTAGGFILSEMDKETEYANTQVARVVAIGPAAFKNDRSGDEWPEGPWYAVGDFVRAPKYGGDRWATKFHRQVPERQVGRTLLPAATEVEDVIFAMFRETDIRLKVTKPLEIKAFY